MNNNDALNSKFDMNTKFTGIDLAGADNDVAGTNQNVHKDTIIMQEKDPSGTSLDTANFVTSSDGTAVKGEYQVNITGNFSAGDTITIGDKTYTAADAAAAGKFEVGEDLTTSVANLVNLINGDATSKYTAVNDTDDYGVSTGIKLVEKTASGTDLSAVSSTKTAESAGTFKFKVLDQFENGDVLTVGGVNLVAGAADGFEVGADINATVNNIRAALAGNAEIDAHFAISGANAEVVLTEKANKATGETIDAPAVSKKSVAGKIEFDMMELSKDATFTIDGNKLTFAKGGTAQESAKELKSLIEADATLGAKYEVAENDGKVTLTQKLGHEGAEKVSLRYQTAAGSGFKATMQIGANTGQSLNIEVGDMRAQALNVTSLTGEKEFVEVDGDQYEVRWTESKVVNNGSESTGVEYALDVTSTSSATAAIEVIDRAVNAVSSERAKLGAFQNRLEYTIKNLDTSAENLQASESRIRDVDMAKEMMEFTKNNILQQAAQAMLAQANQAPQGVLQLLR